MYFTPEENATVMNSVQYIKRHFSYYRYARWFDGWDTPLMRDAALRALMASTARTGERLSNEMYTALAKYHHTLNHQERYLIVNSMPTRQIGGTIARMLRIYHEHHYEYSGAWLNTQNEIIAAALAFAPNAAAPIPPAAFASFVLDVRTQLKQDMTGTCYCGLRSSAAACLVCGAGGR